MALEFPIVRALNHLLASEPWARERLAPFAGEAIELRAPPLPALRVVIAGDGQLAPAAARASELAANEQASSLILSLRPDAPAAALRGEEHLLGAVEVQGNAKLASEVMFLVRHLRWDVEEDLSRVIGDVAAHRLVATARTLVDWHVQAARRLAEGVMEYAVEEAQLLVRREELDEHAAAQARLRDSVERLEKRVERLER